MYDVIIIGGGIVAFATAVYAGRFQLKTLVLGEKFGGALILTDDIANYPGFSQITGMDLFDKVKKHAEDYDIESKMERVTEVSKKDSGFLVKTPDGEYETKTLIYATGTVWRKLKVPGEDEYANKGVHYCALCDGAFYKDKTIAVIGGSDSAAKEALMLTQWAKKVYIIYRGDQIHPEPVNMTRVLANEKIEIINNTNVTEIKGEKFVTTAVLDKEYNGSNELSLDGLFIAIGHIALSDTAKQIGVELNEKGEIKIDRQSHTNIPGVYAAGDVVDSSFKQAITGVSEGVIASFHAYEYITNKAD